jgi:hypothetical protein
MKKVSFSATAARRAQLANQQRAPARHAPLPRRRAHLSLHAEICHVIQRKHDASRARYRHPCLAECSVVLSVDLRFDIFCSWGFNFGFFSITRCCCQHVKFVAACRLIRKSMEIRGMFHEVMKRLRPAPPSLEYKKTPGFG